MLGWYYSRVYISITMLMICNYMLILIKTRVHMNLLFLGCRTVYVMCYHGSQTIN